MKRWRRVNATLPVVSISSKKSTVVRAVLCCERWSARAPASDRWRASVYDALSAMLSGKPLVQLEPRRRRDFVRCQGRDDVQSRNVSSDSEPHIQAC